MDDPLGLKLFWKMLIAGLKVGGYCLTFIIEAGWYACHGRRDKIGDAIGHFGRGFTDAFTDLFK